MKNKDRYNAYFEKLTWDTLTANYNYLIEFVDNNKLAKSVDDFIKSSMNRRRTDFCNRLLNSDITIPEFLTYCRVKCTLGNIKSQLDEEYENEFSKFLEGKEG